MVAGLPGGTESLLTAELASWRDLEGGSVEVLPDVVRVWTKRAFLRKPSVSEEFRASDIDSFRIDGEGRQTLKLVYSGGEESLNLVDPAQTRRLFETLRSLLGPLDEVSRSQMRRDEEERLRIEDDRKRMARLESYVAWVWTAADNYRMLTAGAYRIASALRVELWKDARSEYTVMWRRAESIEQSTGFRLLPGLEELGTALSDANGPRSVEKCAAFIATMAKACMENTLPNPDWDERQMLQVVRPNWDHVKFLLLFSCLYREAALASELGDWVSVETALEGLVRLSPVLKTIFNVPVGDYVERMADAVRKRDVALVSRCSDDLDKHLADSAEKRPHLEAF